MKFPGSHDTRITARTNGIAFKGGSYTLTVTAIVLAILIAVNILVSFLPTTVTKLDISSAQLYSVTSNTKAVVNALEKDVTIYWVVQANEEDDVIENLLAKYESLSDRLKVVKKNPDAYPTFAAQYTDETVTNNSLIVECGDKSRFISYDDIYLTDIDYSTYTYVSSFDGEGAITSAIDYVVSDDLPCIYLLEGHGEAELPEEFADEISKENMEVKSFSLLNEDGVPAEADCVMIYAPTDDISEEEKNILAQYLEEGGKLFVSAGPLEEGSLTNLLGLLENHNVTAADGIVIEGDSYYYAFQQPYIMLPDLVSNDITDPIIEANYYVIMPIAQGLVIDDSADETVTELLSTSDSAFSKLAGYSLDTYDKEEGDIDGPFSLAVSIENEASGELIWISSSCFLDETYNAYSSGANLDFAMNALSDLIGETEAISIRSKSLGYNYLTINESESSFLKAVMIGFLPGMFLVVGIYKVAERKKKRHE